MRSFQLHEDNNDQRTEALHKFLDPWMEHGPNDWDGGNHGISLWLQVSPGDVILIRPDGSTRILEKDVPVPITADSFPNVHAAVLEVELDNGAHHVNRIVGAGTVNLDAFIMPFEYGVDKLCTAETAIAALRKMPRGDEGLDLFCNGEQTEQEAFIESLMPDIPGLREAHDLLNAWFNGWEASDGK